MSAEHGEDAASELGRIQRVVDEACIARGFDNYMLDDERAELTAAIAAVLSAEAAQVSALIHDLGTHLTALCDHPANFERRYDTANGAPCPGCYDARDAFAAWQRQSGRTPEQQ